jgi:succinate dehydrogenase / fumarate reductase flavoprotein subunit
MQQFVGMIRSRQDLETALDRIAAIKKRLENAKVPGNRQYNTGWHTAVDVRHMVVVAEAVARGALTREESRGGHTREDFPKSDDAKWGRVNVILRKDAGAMKTVLEPLPVWPADLEAIGRGTLEAASTHVAGIPDVNTKGAA